MQAFGRFATKYDLEYLVEHYLYFNPEGEAIDIDTLEKMLKNRRKTVAGTLFLYNPSFAPKGYNADKRLSEQGYEITNDLVELQFEKLHDIFAARIKGQEGKLIEVKYLFNYNRPGIEPTSVLETFNEDLEKLHSFQTTRFERDLNYHDVKNLRLTGKFVFFAWGHKFDTRNHKNIFDYAKSVYDQSQKLGKQAAFVYQKSASLPESIEGVKFFHPVAAGKLKTKITEAIARSFEHNPPEPTYYEE